MFFKSMPQCFIFFIDNTALNVHCLQLRFGIRATKYMYIYRYMFHHHLINHTFKYG